ncbi:hypothetical protein LX32DRAFT_17430 [Colletotrichum zoysiae]|uniref:Uncharacterized protein n=1 Tax=Colletotrichum zoysiae TaxID=1216348 RepID=A0AAD9LZE0_9PEZI|nr:hypothetical protein LX32DRAFT_17430 [Colletotrichum zoysiae]
MPKGFEFCCILKFVAKHDRTAPAVSATGPLNEVLQWSVRQQALYHTIDLPGKTKHTTTILVNPSICLWNSIKAEFGASRPALKKATSWATIPTLIFESLTVNWGDYVGSLHRAVELLKLDAQSTNPSRPNIGETNTSSLNTALEVMDRLQTASHVLESNIRTILEIRREAESSPAPWDSFEKFGEKLRFLCCAEEVARELEFQQGHVRSIISRLEAVTMMVRDLINVRNTLTMERMTARTIREAYTMRVIALLTLCFLPPTFIAARDFSTWITLKS